LNRSDYVLRKEYFRYPKQERITIRDEGDRRKGAEGKRKKGK